MEHPKEEKINKWLLENRRPSFNDIKNWSDDFETMVMTCVLADMPLNMDLKDYCRGIDLKERIERYHPYPLWFKTFIRQDIENAIKFFDINKDLYEYGKMIIEEWVDDSSYLNLVKNASPFENNTLKIRFKEVVLSNEREKDGSFSNYNIDQEFHHRITSGEKISFDDQRNGELFYYLKLQEYAELSQSHLNIMSDKSEESESFNCRDVEAQAKITDTDVLILVMDDFDLMFNKEPAFYAGMKQFNKELSKEIRNEGMDYLEDLGEDVLRDIIAFIGGKPLLLAKIMYKLGKHSLQVKKLVDENINISFDQDDADDFFDRFVSAHAVNKKTIKEFYIEDFKIPLKKFYIENRLDFSQLTDSFFENHYRVFMNTRFYSKLPTLPAKIQKEIEKIFDGDIRDTEIFIAISKIQKQIQEDTLEY